MPSLREQHHALTAAVTAAATAPLHQKLDAYQKALGLLLHFTGRVVDALDDHDRRIRPNEK